MGEYVKLVDGSDYYDDNTEMHNSCYAIVGGANMACRLAAKKSAPGDVGLQNEILVCCVIAFVEAFRMRYALTVDSRKIEVTAKMFDAALVWNLRTGAQNITKLNTARATGISDEEYKSYRGLFGLYDANGNPETVAMDVQEKCIREYIAICLWCVRCMMVGAMKRGYRPPPLGDCMCFFSHKMTRFYELFRHELDELNA